MTTENIAAPPSSGTTGGTGGFLSLPNSRIHRNGLVINPETTLEEWRRIGEAFTCADDMLCWYVGDWIVFGESRVKWGDKYTAAIQATHIPYPSLRVFRLVCKAIPLARRIANLSFDHHLAVAGLTPEAQTDWLGQALALQLSTRELRASIKANRILRLADLASQRSDGRGIYTPQGVRSLFERTIRQVTSRLPVSKWTPATRAAWKRELQPIADLYAQL